MQSRPGHRKLVKHYEDPGHVRELTFSCFERMPLLTNDTWREMLSRAIDAAGERHHWRLTAFVFMPEHLHLLWFPLPNASGIEHLLKAIKRPYSYRIKQLLQQAAGSSGDSAGLPTSTPAGLPTGATAGLLGATPDSLGATAGLSGATPDSLGATAGLPSSAARDLLSRLTIRQRPGVTTFRYWQEGPGYDRNLDNEQSVLAAIDYIHENPLRRKLCQTIIDWKWSSARWYADLTDDPSLPKLTPLPPHFFS